MLAGTSAATNNQIKINNIIQVTLSFKVVVNMILAEKFKISSLGTLPRKGLF